MHFLCIIGFAQCLGKLITAGGVFHAAVNTGDTAFHFFNSHALNQTGNCLKISLTAAGEFNIFNNISVQLHCEGKTLVSTLPAYLNALEGKGVCIVTVNDYLAKRDAEWMGQVHEFLGLKVGVVSGCGI